MSAALRVELGSRGYPIHIGEGLLDQPALYAPHVAGRRAAVVTNEQDAKQVHNHGLNLSRAWCMRGIMQVLVPGGDARWQRFGALARDHVIAAEAAITGGEYVSTHWLISFALLADTEWHA